MCGNTSSKLSATASIFHSSKARRTVRRVSNIRCSNGLHIVIVVIINATSGADTNSGVGRDDSVSESGGVDGVADSEAISDTSCRSGASTSKVISIHIS